VDVKKLEKQEAKLKVKLIQHLIRKIFKISTIHRRRSKRGPRGIFTRALNFLINTESRLVRC
jgi:hypothetical protein